MYKNELEKYAGNNKEGRRESEVEIQKEKFLKIFDFWCDKKEKYFILFIV
jgi:hypothetical protein